MPCLACFWCIVLTRGVSATGWIWFVNVTEQEGEVQEDFETKDPATSVSQAIAHDMSQINRGCTAEGDNTKKNKNCALPSQEMEDDHTEAEADEALGPEDDEIIEQEEEGEVPWEQRPSDQHLRRHCEGAHVDSDGEA